MCQENLHAKLENWRRKYAGVQDRALKLCPVVGESWVECMSFLFYDSIDLSSGRGGCGICG